MKVLTSTNKSSLFFSSTSHSIRACIKLGYSHTGSFVVQERRSSHRRSSEEEGGIKGYTPIQTSVARTSVSLDWTRCAPSKEQLCNTTKNIVRKRSTKQNPTYSISHKDKNNTNLLIPETTGRQQQNKPFTKLHPQMCNLSFEDNTAPSKSPSSCKRSATHNPVDDLNRQQEADNIEVLLEPVDDTQFSARHSSGDQDRRAGSRASRPPGQSRYPLTKLQRKCFKMIVSVAVMFLVLNFPSHVIRLQSLARQIFQASYRGPSYLEYHLQLFFQSIYYLNFLVNVIIYGACDKTFQLAFLHLPQHVATTVRQVVGTLTKKKSATFAKRRRRKAKETLENSRFVEICIGPQNNSPRAQNMTSNRPSPKSPPCLLKLSSVEKLSSK